MRIALPNASLPCPVQHMLVYLGTTLGPENLQEGFYNCKSIEDVKLKAAEE